MLYLYLRTLPHSLHCAYETGVPAGYRPLRLASCVSRLACFTGATLIILLAGLILATGASASEGDGLRKPAAIIDPPPTDPIALPKAETPQRRFPQQPPLIPHSVRDQQVDLNANHCLHCHAPARRKILPSTRVPAPTISVSHYINRQGQLSDHLDGRRYFCQQCHVPQYHSHPLVEPAFLPANPPEGY